tara:strand:+ start:4315 stop:4665 length:351 start_codon:yes stop_codon:yes gene_type:complete
MSRITYTKKGNPADNRDTTKSIASAPLSVRLLWVLGNVFGFTQIKRNAKKSRGYSISVGKTFTAFNFGKFVAYKRNPNPSRDVWFKRTMVRGEYQFTPPSFTNTTMQMIRIPASNR